MAKQGSKANRGGSEGESIQGYFRGVFQENPKLLNTRSNDELLKRWLADHPGETEVPDRVKGGLSNLKSVLRSKGRKRRAAKAAAQESAGGAGQRPMRKKSGLETLEEQIDECLTLARTLDREKLESVISHLRRARNEVVWKLGQ